MLSDGPEMIGGQLVFGLVGKVFEHNGQVGVEPLDLGAADRFTAVEWNAVVEVRDRTGEGEVLAIQTKKARSTHLNEREARREAFQQAGEFVSETFSAWLDERIVPRASAENT